MNIMKRWFVTASILGVVLSGSEGAWGHDKLEFPESSFSRRLVPVGRILEDPNSFVWGCSPIYGPDENVHLFYARWPAKDGFTGWKGKDSGVGHAMAAEAEGPYEIVQKAIGLNKALAAHAGGEVWAHNPEIQKMGDDYVMIYNWNRVSAGKGARKIGLAFADSLQGPWSIQPEVIGTGPEGAWDHVTVLNPTLIEHPKGRFLIYYRTWDRDHNDKIGVAISETIRGPYTKYENNPVIDPAEVVGEEAAGLEDPFAWVRDGGVSILTRDFGVFKNRETPHDEGSGLLFSSEAGLNFSHLPEIAYHGTLRYYREDEIKPGPRWRRFERPKLLLKAGQPTHLFNALGGGAGATSSGHVFKIAETRDQQTSEARGRSAKRQEDKPDSGPKRLIWDTDMDSDIDDAAALAILHRMADLGEVEILATVSGSPMGYSVELVDVINTYYGRPDLPTGITRYGEKNSWILEGDTVVSEYPHDVTAENAPAAVEVYRRVLSKQADKSVTIATMGHLTNPAHLIETEADEHSPLSGKELVKEKVKETFIIGGAFPWQGHDHGNFDRDAPAADKVAEEWPVKIHWIGGDEDFIKVTMTGKGLRRVSKDNPVRYAYELAGKLDSEHHSGDLIATYIAVRGTQPYFKVRRYGYNTIQADDGGNQWRTDGNKAHIYTDSYRRGVSPEDFAEVLNSMLSAGRQ